MYEEKIAKIERKLVKKGFTPTKREISGANYWAYDESKNVMFYSKLDSLVLKLKRIELNNLHSCDIVNNREDRHVKLRFYTQDQANVVINCDKDGCNSFENLRDGVLDGIMDGNLQKFKDQK